MAEKFAGTWNLVHSDNFDGYMKEIGIGMMTRMAGAAVKPTLTFEVSPDGAHWKFTSKSTFKTHDTEFDLGKEVFFVVLFTPFNLIWVQSCNCTSNAQICAPA